MRDDADVRFTAHEIARDELRALTARSNGPALRRGVWHLGMLIVTGTLLWRWRSTIAAVPLIVAQGYMLAFLFCALHETAHRTAFRTRWLNAVLGTLAGLLVFWPLPELPRLSLGASSVHAGPRAGSRAVLPEARLVARVPLRIDRYSQRHPPYR